MLLPRYADTRCRQCKVTGRALRCNVHVPPPVTLGATVIDLLLVKLSSHRTDRFPYPVHNFFLEPTKLTMYGIGREIGTSPGSRASSLPLNPPPGPCPGRPSSEARRLVCHGPASPSSTQGSVSSVSGLNSRLLSRRCARFPRWRPSFMACPRIPSPTPLRPHQSSTARTVVPPSP